MQKYWLLMLSPLYILSITLCWWTWYALRCQTSSPTYYKRLYVFNPVQITLTLLVHTISRWSDSAVIKTTGCPRKGRYLLHPRIIFLSILLEWDLMMATPIYFAVCNHRKDWIWMDEEARWAGLEHQKKEMEMLAVLRDAGAHPLV